MNLVVVGLFELKGTVLAGCYKLIARSFRKRMARLIVGNFEVPWMMETRSEQIVTMLARFLAHR